ncbi:MAG: fused MFS/spermidine synthase, partial [Elusimicrobiota bacterium]
MNIKRKLLFIFFLTGATGLIYQILWARILGTIFGNSMYAISTVLASFMGGLALGSRYFGKLIDNNKINLLQSFSKIQLAIGLYAALTPLIFSGVHKIYGIVGSTQINFFTTFLIFIVCFVIILIPTTLMGGTLPILSKYFTQEKTRENDSADFSIARLYAVNTLGAVLGAFLTAYFMVRIIGVRGTIYFSVIINLLVAYYVNSLNKKTGPVFSHIKEKMPSSSASALLLIIVGISGLTTFVYEITWTRILSMVLGSSVYAYATMLCAFLTGISLGSFIFAKFSRRYGFKDIKKKLITFGYIQAGIGISVLLLIPVFGVLPLVFLRIFKMTG